MVKKEKNYDKFGKVLKHNYLNKFQNIHEKKEIQQV